MAISAWRKAAHRGDLEEWRAVQAIEGLAELHLGRALHRGLLPRIWELRHNVTSCDAAHVALAEWLGAPLVTADARLARAPGLGCEVELLR